jgi:formylglycine-generating enzyme required for sulfatase activity
MCYRVLASVKKSITPVAPNGMLLIPSGSFSMGDNLDDQIDAPVHAVDVSSFYMDKYEVTKAKWDKVASWASTNGYDINTSSASGKASSHPAHTLTWYVCAKWCNACSQKEGLQPCYTVGGVVYKTGNSAPACNWTATGYRLPTEAEWEKAARGGLSGKRFPWGDTINHNFANYCANGSAYIYDISPYSTYWFHPLYSEDATVPFTSPVGAFAANGYGLYDMAGNVWEWCWDWYGFTYYSNSPSSDPRGPSSGDYRVVRGGNWSFDAYHCRTAYHYGFPPSYSDFDLGFRSVRRVP